MKKIFVILLLSTSIQVNFGQSIYHHISHKSLYNLLDELANQQVIDLNTVAKPYSRMVIAKKLQEASQQTDLLNNRQQQDIAFYLKDFNKELKPDKEFDKRLDLLYKKDSVFTFSINPIGGIQYWTNKNGAVWHRWNGAEAFAYWGDHWGFYASLRDNHENEKLSEDQFLNQRTGGNYKAHYDYSEMMGGITYSWNWGIIGLVKDHFTWGTNYNGSNIFSGRTPSFAHIKVNLKPVSWFEFNYVHGWLVSEVVDSSRSYFLINSYGTDYREVFYKKFIATNLFTFTPLKKLNISVGNSIVYSDIGIHPGYLIPLFFFKSVDHTLNSGIDNQNSQMFFDISSRQLKNLHIYASFFVDEVSIGRMFKPEEHSNFFSTKLGFRANRFPVQNMAVTAEYTRTNPLSFMHYVPTLTFESNRFNLGHYLRDNCKELYLSLEAKPLRGLFLKASYTFAQKGPDYTALGTHRLGIPFMESVEWESSMFSLSARYEIINDGFVFAGYTNGNVSGNENWSPAFWYGKTNTFNFGINLGF